ncbi:MAG: acyl-CoA reductase [Crocinitomicaceae bacterium]|nr:acyl-CoA reductase [Crocinitomicaceae bacterium]
MILNEKIKLLSKLGGILDSLAEGKPWPGFQIGLSKSEYEEFDALMNKVQHHNGWFTKEAVKTAFKGIASWLTEENLSHWVNQYSFKVTSPKRVAIIMAGNIPLVGFHDFLSVFLSGHKAIIKLSSSDQHLMKAIFHYLNIMDARVEEYVEIKEQFLGEFDAVIATGSNNSATYFESYFGKHPHIIRRNRTSVAVIDGSETKEELTELGKDIFTYFGLGCRNVSQLWIPTDFDLNRFFEAIYTFNPIINHNKYANNYDYNKAVYLMNKANLLDNGFLLLKEDFALNSPPGMLHYVRYQDSIDAEHFLNENKDKIQVIVGKNYIPFGMSQNPGLTDYADGVDTMKFLEELK